MDSRKYSMYMLFFPIPEDVFILCIGFFLPIPGDVFEAEIIDFVFYVSHRDYIYILYLHTRFCTYLYSLKGKAF